MTRDQHELEIFCDRIAGRLGFGLTPDEARLMATFAALSGQFTWAPRKPQPLNKTWN